MKKFSYLLLFPIFFACSNQEELARSELQKAQDFYDRQEYSNARQTLDSLKIKYPKVFPVLKEGQQLVKKIEQSLQAQNFHYCDSMIRIEQAKIKSLTEGFIFEKDTAYEDIGKYVYKTQSIERNIQKTYIRSYTNELGEMTLSSVYYGGRPIKHSALLVSIHSGESAQTASIISDGSSNYTFNDEGMTTETVSYTNGKDNGVILFIYNNAQKPVKATFRGQKEISVSISEADKTALIRTYNLSVTLSEIEKLKKGKEIARQKLEMLQ